MSAARRIDDPTPSDDEETLLLSKPITPNSTTRPSAAPDLPRDTICDPPRPAWHVAVFHFFLKAFLFVPREIVHWIARQWRGFWIRFEDPPLADLLPYPTPILKQQYWELPPDQLTEQIAQDLFRIPTRYLSGLLRIVSLLHTTRRDGPEARFDIFVVFNLSRLADNHDDLVPIARVRKRLPEVYRQDVNSSLLRLEREGWIELEVTTTDDVGLVRNGFHIPSRGVVTHIRVLQWLQ